MGAPILAAFLAGQYVAGRNCEESALREEIAGLKATAKASERLIEISEARRLESEARLALAGEDYRKALTNAKRADPALGECLGRKLPDSLRLNESRPADPAG